MTTRRNFMMQGAVATAALALPRMASATPGFTQVRGQTALVQLAPPDYPKTEIWGYDGLMPGPALRLDQGARVQRRFQNDLPQASSIHWHGIRIDNAMDGVPGLTQPAVAPGAGFDYDFTVPDAGTYWYHAHNRSVEQVARGLYGALIVAEKDAPDADRDEVLILDDWLLDPETAQINADFEAPHDRSHGGRSGNFIATNGQFNFETDVQQHERLRLRLINAANARIFGLGLAGMTGWIVALDGMPLAQPEPVTEALILGPGQRADLIVDITAAQGESAHLVRLDGKDPVSQAAFPVTGQAATTPRSAPKALPPNSRVEVTGLETATKLRLNMQGGAMGSLDAAILNGSRTSFGDMVKANEFWSFNGIVGMTDTPLATLSRGETVSLDIVNDTAFPHAMHLHGMHFREVMADGSQGPFRDTLLLAGGESRTIGFIADNPGDWLFHCHMLSHAASGMMTWIRVA